MTETVDVAIVGAGPAGGSAANALVESGLSVIVLEKAELPRAKACGGLMPATVQKWLDCDLDRFAGNQIKQVRNLNNYSQPVEQDVSGEHLLLVNRAQFDAYLLEQAVRRSGGRISLRQGFVLQKAVEQPDGVELHARNHEQIRARFVIAADGVASRTARSLGLRHKPDLAVAIDSEIEVTDECWERESRRLTFNFFCLPSGYGWIFPKQKPVLSCGVGCWLGEADVRMELEKFLEQSLQANERLAQFDRAFPIPIWSGTGQIATRRVALAGDAAGLVDPISGEGIRYAILSGRLAAQTAVAAAVAGEDNGMLPYADTLYSQLQHGFDLKRRFVFLPFTQSPDYFYRNFVGDAHGYTLGLNHAGSGVAQVSGGGRH